MVRSARAESPWPSATFALAATLGLGGAACGEADADSIFQNLRIEEITDRGAYLRFDTTIATTCEAALGTEPGTYDRRFLDPDMDPDNPFVFEHDVPLTGLAPETRHYVRAEAEDASGRRYVSEALSFTTLLRAEGTPENFAELAAGTTVVARSSNWADAPDDGAFGAHLAIDGDFRSEWSTFGDGDDAFLELDLGQERELGAVRIQSRQMTDGTSIVRSFQLIVDGTTTYGPFSTPDPDTVYTFELQPPVSGQRVRFEALDTSGGNTGLQEFQLYETMFN